MEKTNNLNSTHIRFYPPIPMAMGTSFLSWLFFSVTWDSFFGKVQDILIAVIFLILFIITFLFCMISWGEVLRMRKRGLYFKERSLIYIDTNFFKLKTQQYEWIDIKEVKFEKDKLLFSTNEKTFLIPVDTLLENPDWIVEQIRIRIERENKEHETIDPEISFNELEIEMNNINCSKCGGSVNIDLTYEKNIKCPFCGDKEGISAKTDMILKKVKTLIAGLPQAHRQVHEKVLRRFIADRKKYKKKLLQAGWGTGIFWMIIVVVSLISDLADKEQGINFLFTGVVSGIAVFSILSSIILSYFINKVAGTFSLPFNALPSASSEGNARCRHCGATLKDKGIIIRCAYCSSDNIVSGKILKKAEIKAKTAMKNAFESLNSGTEAGARHLDRIINNMQALVFTQVFWLHIPVMVAIDGSTGMLIRVTGTCLLILLGTIISGLLGFHWLKKGRASQIHIHKN